MDSGLTFDWDGVSIEEDLVNIEFDYLARFSMKDKL